jgi:hypothetical protein
MNKQEQKRRKAVRKTHRPKLISRASSQWHGQQLAESPENNSEDGPPGRDTDQGGASLPRAMHDARNLLRAGG